MEDTRRWAGGVDTEWEIPGLSSAPGAEELCFLDSGKQGSVCMWQQEDGGGWGASHSVYVYRILCPLACARHVETSVPNSLP